MEFYREEPTARTSWRLSVLMGGNTRTYKFALAHALLTVTEQGRDSITLQELAIPYSLAMAEHSLLYPQAGAVELGPNDFLSVLTEEAQYAIDANTPSERLIDAAAKSMPAMVMQKFHNLRGEGDIAHRFYEVRGRGSARTVVLTDDLRFVVQSQRGSLESELASRWSIVESSFDSHIGRSLIGSGLVIADEGTMFRSPVRRVAITGARTALGGFQHGRCFYCQDPLAELVEVPHVDHVFPFRLMNTGAWSGPDLNGVWNLVVACAPCNGVKSDRAPTPDELQRLAARNEAIMMSPQPLKRSLELALSQAGSGRTPKARREFLKTVDRATPWGT